MEILADNQQQMPEQQAEAEIVEINYYTDPLCCWSWAFEPQWRRLRYEYRDLIKWKYTMGGMVQDWKSYDDPMNLVTKPIQMGPLWMEARNISGMPIRDSIWIDEYPESSYPACIAVKSAGLQSRQAEDLYLRKVREALMLRSQDISKLSVLLELAASLAKEQPGLLDYDRFTQDFDGAGRDAFREDLKQVRYLNISRFPTLTMNIPGKAGVIITGYRPYDVLLQGLQRVLADVKTDRSINVEDYKQFWGDLTEREIKEIL